eukprot:436878-Prorocentrum_minimum.AAC.2
MESILGAGPGSGGTGGRLPDQVGNRSRGGVYRRLAPHLRPPATVPLPPFPGRATRPAVDNDPTRA